MNIPDGWRLIKDHERHIAWKMRWRKRAWSQKWSEWYPVSEYVKLKPNEIYITTFKKWDREIPPPRSDSRGRLPVLGVRKDGSWISGEVEVSSRVRSRSGIQRRKAASVDPGQIELVGMHQNHNPS